MGILITPVFTELSAVDAPIVTNTTAETSLLGAAGKGTFAAGVLNEGSNIGIELFGVFSNKATSPGTLTLRAYLGSTVVWSSGASPIPATLHTDLTFWLKILLMCRAGGVNGKVRGAGLLQAVLGSQTDFPLPPTLPPDSGLFNMNIDLDLDLTAQFSVADPGNKIQLLGIQVPC